MPGLSRLRESRVLYARLDQGIEASAGLINRHITD